jgi:hypothetical protein
MLSNPQFAGSVLLFGGFFTRCPLICALFFQEKAKIVEIKATLNTP